MGVGQDNLTCAENSHGHSVHHKDVLMMKGTTWLNDEVTDLCSGALQWLDTKQVWGLERLADLSSLGCKLEFTPSHIQIFRKI